MSGSEFNRGRSVYAEAARVLVDYGKGPRHWGLELREGITDEELAQRIYSIKSLTTIRLDTLARVEKLLRKTCRIPRCME